MVSEWARTNPKVSEVYFIGSQVKGEATPDSDLDIAIRLEEPHGYTDWFHESDEWKMKLSEIMDVKVHLLRGGGTLKNDTVTAAIDEYGCLVYTREVKPQ